MDKMEINDFREMGYSEEQLVEIREGINAGIDIKPYLNKEFEPIQMHEIRMGIMSGVPVEIYADTKYDWFQMEEIRLGYEHGVDVSLYADPDMPYDRMRQIRRGLEDGINLLPYKDYKPAILRELRKAIKSHIDLIPYIEEGYDSEQLEQIRIACEHGIGIKPHINVELRGVSIEQISKGLALGLDVSVYGNLDYNWQQMRQIRHGLQARLDLKYFCNPMYTWEQMQEIILGLKDNLDVTKYNSLIYSAGDMKRIREEMLSQKEKETAVSTENTYDEDEIANNTFITVTDDEMAAYIEIRKGFDITAEAIREALKNRGIENGIIESSIKNIVERNWYEKSVLVAVGKKPVTGKDGYYEFFFDTEISRKPLLLPDGSVDYQNTKWYCCVKQGDLVAKYHPAEYGVPGLTVLGREMPANKGSEKNLLPGKGFTLSQNQQEYYASIDGKVEYKNGHLEIDRMLEVEDVSSITGNIDFDGSVHIKGNVMAGSVIRATEDIIIDGFVESSVIESGRCITLNKGANANGGGKIVAGDTINGKFFEEVYVSAKGDINFNYALNSEINCGGILNSIGKNSTIIGGSVHADKGINATNVGNKTGVRTLLSLGIGNELRKRMMKVSNKLKDVEQQIEMLTKAKNEMESKMNIEDLVAMPVFSKIENAIYTKEIERKKLITIRGQLAYKSKVSEAVVARIYGTVFEGTTIEIDGLYWKAYEIRDVIAKRVGKKISVAPA